LREAADLVPKFNLGTRSISLRLSPGREPGGGAVSAHGKKRQNGFPNRDEPEKILDLSPNIPYISLTRAKCREVLQEALKIRLNKTL
jgi:hypothetical protein